MSPSTEPTGETAPEIVVFGSINMDLVARTPRLPIAGETIMGTQFETVPGGKGANQAVAAARLGRSVAMVGRVGDDAFGIELRHRLREEGIECDCLSLTPNQSTGVALIEVDEAGENRIIVIPGANNQVNKTDAKHLAHYFDTAKVLLLQLEVPVASTIAAAALASSAGLKVILDPAPALPNLPEELGKQVSVLTPNRLEASQLVGFSIESLADAERASQVLRNREIHTVVIKLGEEGSLCVTPDEVIHTPSFPVEVVDTVAAGDAFNGGLAVAFAEGRSLRDSLRWATAVAAFAVTHPGAQFAMPNQSDLHAFFTMQGVTL